MIALTLGMALSFALEITAVEAEHSKDSSSTTTTIKVSGAELRLSRRRRAPRGRRNDFDKKRALDAALLTQIQQLVADSGLQRAANIDEPLDGPGLDYTFDLDVTVEGKRKQLHLHGPVSMWRGNGKPDAPAFTRRPEYAAAVQLVRALEALAEPMAAPPP